MKPMIAVMAVVWVAACAPSEPESRLPGPVKAVVERTKTPRQTYAVYAWNRMQRDGRPAEEWAAEFHAGALHRVETMRDRLVADCDAQTGAALSLETGKIFKGPEVARAACGINTNKAFVEAEWQGVTKTRFGDVDRIRLVDDTDIRTYDVTSGGVIVRSTYTAKDPAKSDFLAAEALAVLDHLPATDIFSEASLSQSYVPDAYKVAPKAGR